jgi:hypothetical protein
VIAASSRLHHLRSLCAAVGKLRASSNWRCDGHFLGDVHGADHRGNAVSTKTRAELLSRDVKPSNEFDARLPVGSLTGGRHRNDRPSGRVSR